MKTGFENKRNLVVLIALLVILGGCVWYFVDKMYLGGPAPKTSSSIEANPGPSAAATERAEVARANKEAAAANQNGREAKKIVPLESLDPTLHPEVMAGAESLAYSGDGRNIFSMNSAPTEKIDAPIGPVRPSQTQTVAQTGPPPPPPIDLTFFGYESAGGAKKAFILHGDDVFVAMEGEVVDHHYKVLKINPLSIQVTDLLYNNTQTLNLAQS
jgi:hypothetical protein